MNLSEGNHPHVSIAIPMMGELENIDTLLGNLRKQDYKNFSLYCCINQPEDASGDVYRENNTRTIELLQAINDIDVHIIDRSSPGKGWSKKQKGVGYARKLLFETIIKEQHSSELIISLDADTRFESNHVAQIIALASECEYQQALCLPYYHPLPPEETLQRTLLRYEIYMRYFLINMLLIDNPYAFTAIGSAMAFSADKYKACGGITPLQAGEDFYLMQKFSKTCGVQLCSAACVYPEGRISKRVPFGTGPAISKKMSALADSYPLYPVEAFGDITNTFNLFEQLYTEDIATPLDNFLRLQMREKEIWEPLRKNFKSKPLFVRACRERIDGLRVLQYLHHHQHTHTHISDETTLNQLLLKLNCPIVEGLSFKESPIDTLDDIRNRLFEKEMQLRQQYPLRRI